MIRTSLPFLLSLTVIATSFFLLAETIPQFYSYSIPNHTIEITLFLYGLTLASYIFLIHSGQKGNTSLIHAIISTIVVKLILSIVFIGIFIYIQQTNATADVVYFITTYLIFTGLEIIFLFKKISNS